MSVTLNAGRQEIIAARVVVTFGTGNDISATGTYPVFSIPNGAIIVGGSINMSDATTALVDLHLGDGGDDNRYADNVDGATVARTSLTVTDYKYTVADTIDLLVDTATPSAAGQCEIIIEYIQENRSAFTQS